MLALASCHQPGGPAAQRPSDTRMSNLLLSGLSLFLLGTGLGRAPVQDQGFTFKEGDTVCLLGNALAERMQHAGFLEAFLQLRRPDLALSFRNLGFSADELTVQQRTAGFGSWDEHLTRCGADVVFAFFGFNESFAGQKGLPDFRENLTAFIEHTRAQRYNGTESPRLVLCSPVPHENLGDPNLPDGRDANERIQAYAAAMEAVAMEHGVPFIDLFTTLKRTQAQASRPLSINGIHLTPAGNKIVAELIVSALFAWEGGPENQQQLERVLTAVRHKNLLWFNRYRATDGYNVYGGRSSLKYTDEQSNFTVLQRELEILDALCVREDSRIHALAADRAPEAIDTDIPQAIPVITNRPGAGPGGAYIFRDGQEAIDAMTPAPDFEVGLFADELAFPELVNPVQMSWDTRGRLWVAAWPTYPHWAPGTPMNDKLLVFEDTDGDGQADTCIPFADDLHNPTGFEFWGGGVFVASAPDLLFLKDTDGDGRADSRTRVLHGLSSGDTHHSANSFVLGHDGALYFQEGVFHQTQIETIHGPMRNNDGCVWRFEPRTWRVERYVPYNFANPHGHVFDAWGQDFVTDGTGNNNYYALPFSGHAVHPQKRSGGLWGQGSSYFTFFPQRSRPCAATEILSSSLFPAENQGNYLIANVIGFQGIFQYAIRDDGSGFSATEVDPVVHSSDPNFRPSDIEVGPDGAIYFLDWHNPLIGHMQHHLRDPSRDGEHGRIYRVTPKGKAAGLRPVPVAGRPIDELLELLKHPDDRLRYRARIELSAHDSDAVVAAAGAWVARLDQASPNYEHDRLEALWLTQQHNRPDAGLLGDVLSSPDPRARAAAVRVARGLRHTLPQVIERLAQAIEDEHPRVRLEALVALSFFEEARAAELALRVLERPMDRFLEYALSQTLTTLEPYWKPALVKGRGLAQDHDRGLAHLLAGIDTAELALVAPGPAAWAEQLERPGLEPAAYLAAAQGLAQLQGERPETVLLTAIRAGDAGQTSAGGHTDHLLMGLFGALASGAGEREALATELTELATGGQRSSTRRLATVASLRSASTVDALWEAAAESLGGLGNLLDALPLVTDREILTKLEDRVLPLLAGLPEGLAPNEGKGDSNTIPAATVGRFVRVELPGEERTLTLAEVEVFGDGGKNIAGSGTATQSTLAHGGVPDRALDGNRSSSWTDSGQTHTIENRPNPWWELDLRADRDIERIAVWGRDDTSGLRARLDGFRLRVLDQTRRTVFEASIDRAQVEPASFDLTSPGLRIRRAAAAALAPMAAADVGAADIVMALVRSFSDPDMRRAVGSALRAIPADRWPEEARLMLAKSLVKLFDTGTSAEYESAAGRELLSFAAELATRLPGPQAVQLRDRCRRLGPQVLLLRPVPDTLLYDRSELVVVAGHPVELVFDNVDIMPHNLVVTAPGALATVGLAAEAMAQADDAWDRNFVPDLPEVLQATGLLQPGQSETLTFTAPTEPGAYPFVCTFPGHWVRMNGVLHVVATFVELDEQQLAAAAAAYPGPEDSARAFVRNWSMADFATVELDERDTQAGRATLETASCLRCHSIDNAGGTTGPELTEVVARHDARALLTHIIAPSETILEGYETEIFVTHDGEIIAGRVLEETASTVLVRDDPYQELDPLELRREEIANRAPTTVSTMPTGLLTTFTREEILDLLAFLKSL